MDIRMIAHDMRTPLNALRLGIQAAKTAPDPQALQSSLELAERNITALSDIVESLVDLSIEGKGELSLRPLRPSDLVTNAIDQIKPLAEQRGVTIRAKEADLPPLVADESRLIRVLVNLLSNAVRFSPPNESIVVDAKARSNDGHKVVVFSVRDNGPGVTPADIDRIFVAGVSLPNSGKSSKGLGLAVCKEIVEAHGGRIWVEIGKTPGATFSFSIPCKSGAAKQICPGITPSVNP